MSNLERGYNFKGIRFPVRCHIESNDGLAKREVHGRLALSFSFPRQSIGRAKDQACNFCPLNINAPELFLRSHLAPPPSPSCTGPGEKAGKALVTIRFWENEAGIVADTTACEPPKVVLHAKN